MSALHRAITPRTIPKAYYERRLSVDDVMSNRMIKPLHVLDRSWRQTMPMPSS